MRIEPAGGRVVTRRGPLRWQTTRTGLCRIGSLDQPPEYVVDELLPAESADTSRMVRRRCYYTSGAVSDLERVCFAKPFLNRGVDVNSSLITCVFETRVGVVYKIGYLGQAAVLIVSKRLLGTRQILSRVWLRRLPPRHDAEIKIKYCSGSVEIRIGDRCRVCECVPGIIVIRERVAVTDLGIVIRRVTR